MKKILLDTNFLLLPFTHKIDIFSEFERILLEKIEVYVLDRTIEELKFIQKAAKKLKDRMNAKLALELIKRKGIKIINTGKGKTDDIIINISKSEGFIVATLDKELKKRLIKEGVNVIYLKGRKLEIEWL